MQDAEQLPDELRVRLEALARGVGIRGSGQLRFYFSNGGRLGDWRAELGPFGPAALERYESAGRKRG